MNFCLFELQFNGNCNLQDMLSKSKASDSGIKLEVNEKILDACTALMKSIRELVQKSRVLQAEIVALGKGTASATEFYKRNHQWTEGLISAAKNVAQGANFLVYARFEESLYFRSIHFIYFFSSSLLCL